MKIALHRSDKNSIRTDNSPPTFYAYIGAILENWRVSSRMLLSEAIVHRSSVSGECILFSLVRVRRRLLENLWTALMSRRRDLAMVISQQENIAPPILHVTLRPTCSRDKSTVNTFSLERHAPPTTRCMGWEVCGFDVRFYWNREHHEKYSEPNTTSAFLIFWSWCARLIINSTFEIYLRPVDIFIGREKFIRLQHSETLIILMSLILYQTVFFIVIASFSFNGFNFSSSL